MQSVPFCLVCFVFFPSKTMIFSTRAAANKINGRLAESIQEVGFLNKHIVSKLIHTPVVYRRGGRQRADRPLRPDYPPSCRGCSSPQKGRRPWSRFDVLPAQYLHLKHKQ